MITTLSEKAVVAGMTLFTTGEMALGGVTEMSYLLLDFGNSFSYTIFHIGDLVFRSLSLSPLPFSFILMKGPDLAFVKKTSHLNTKLFLLTNS